MTRIHRFFIAIVLLYALAAAVPAAAQQEPTSDLPDDRVIDGASRVAPSASGTITDVRTLHAVYLPLIGTPAPLNPFGFDVRTHAPDTVMPLVVEASPRWSRAGDVLWALVEPVRGGGYRWEAIADVERNVRRLRAAGIEPTLVVQWSPSWAQSIPGKLCSAPRPDTLGDFAAFMRAAAQRFSSGDLRVDYWEIWNEPDFRPDEVKGDEGFGCWATYEAPYYGGDYYGRVLRAVYPAVKAGNPNAQVWGGALMHRWPDDTDTLGFVRGMLAASAANSFDALSFHAYGEWGAGDRLLFKYWRLRRLLDDHGLRTKPMVATEIAATCTAPSDCPPDFRRRQANYAARIYAQAIALNLLGAFWYPVSFRGEGFLHSHLIDETDDGPAPRPSFYAFRNSARLLAGARYVGPPPLEPAPGQVGEVQVLPFEKGRNRLYVLWVPRTDFP
ncbi:MAG: hypothetical protein RMJ54_18330, partial [Roseiflexaceae bacterium]|nr:hypothetical protein [Roseiflexaceae bacterium]